MGACAPTSWDERAVRTTRQPACSESTPGESGGQGCCCCHDNPGGRGPRSSGLLPGGRRLGGRGRLLSVASARPRVPCSVPGGGGGPQSAQLPAPRACATAHRGLARAGLVGLAHWATGRTASERRKLVTPAAGHRVELFIALGSRRETRGCFLTLSKHVCDLIKHFLLSLKSGAFWFFFNDISFLSEALAFFGL